MKPKPLPNFSPEASALLDTVVLDILHGHVGIQTIEAARELDELIDTDDLDFLLVLIGAPQIPDFRELNMLALEELIRYLGGEA